MSFRIATPKISYAGPLCIVFYYHMRGSGIGYLNIYVSNSSGEHLLWREGEYSFNDWQESRLYLDLIEEDSQVIYSIMCVTATCESLFIMFQVTIKMLT